jgi:hypothetical protein
MMSDAELAELERAWLDRLARALGLDPEAASRAEEDLRSLL